MQALKQSTIIIIKLGPFLSKTDAVTEQIALTPAVEVSKNGAAFAARNSATAVSHDAEGYYAVELDATDSNTLGRLRVKAHDSATHLPVWQDYMIMPANVWDSLFGADVLQVDLTQMGGIAQSATDLKDFADAGYDPITNKVQGVVLCDSNTDMRGTNGASMFDPATQVVDVGKISGSTLAADNLGASASVVVVAAAVTGTLTTVEMTTNLTESTNDHYKGRLIIWTSGVLTGQATEITGYIGGTGKLSYTATTEAPGIGDSFVVV